MLLIRDSRVINDGFIIQFHERIHHNAGGRCVQLRFLRKNDRVQILNIDALGGALGGDLGLKDFALFLIALADVKAMGFQVLDNHIDALGGVLHDDFEFEVLRSCDSLFQFSAINEHETIGLIDTTLDLLERGQSEPARQSCHILDLIVWLHIQQN